MIHYLLLLLITLKLHCCESISKVAITFILINTHSANELNCCGSNISENATVD